MTPPTSTPAHIGAYPIIRELGRGGMGIVYLADDPTIERQVALKLLPAELAADETARRRFEREVALVTGLEHPHIVPIYAVDLSGAAPFLVMRYLPGGTLRERLAGGGLSPTTLWQTMHQVAGALDYAHARSVIHRDIKPTNILYDGDKNAYVTDFGIAKIVNSTIQLTSTSTLTGTPAYMSPEQFKGQAVDGRADQYSLAVILFEALTGQLPFSGDTLQMMYQHVHELPPAIHVVDHDLPPALSTVLERALAKDPVKRYPSASAFIIAAEAATQTRPAVKPAPAPPPPVVKPAAAVPAASVAKPAAPAARSTTVQMGFDATPKIVDGAGGVAAGAPKPNRRPLVVVGAVLGLLALTAFLLLWLPRQTGATVPDTPQPAPTVVAVADTVPAPAPTAAPAVAAAVVEEPVAGRQLLIVDGGRAALWRGPDGDEPLELGATLSFDEATPLTFVTDADPLTVGLDDGTRLDLAVNTEATVMLVADADDLYRVRLAVPAGQVVVTTDAAEPFAEPGADLPGRGRGIEVTNPPGARAWVQQGMMGVISSLRPLRFEVDCLEGECIVFGDLGGEVALKRGEATIVGGNGVPGDPQPARYELYDWLGDLVATPTPTATVTGTATATRTPTATRTRRATATPLATSGPVVAPTSTSGSAPAAPTQAPAATQRPGGNNPTATPRPPTPTDTPVPYVPPTATPQPYVPPPPTDTPEPYVPPTPKPPKPTSTPYP